MAYGTVQAYRTPGGGQAHFGTSVAAVFGHITYIAIAGLIVNRPPGLRAGFLGGARNRSGSEIVTLNGWAADPLGRPGRDRRDGYTHN
jgi:hypothetical protein